MIASPANRRASRIDEAQSVQVGPGETLDIEVELGRMSARAGKGRGVASVAGQVACEAELLFIITDG